MKFKLTHNIMKLLLLFVMTFLPIVTWADPVEINGIWYNLVSKAKQAEVTSNPDNQSKYTGDVILPESVTYENTNYSVISIGIGAFNSCNSLTSVTIPNSVTSIGNNAFSGCVSLISVIIPNNVTSIGIGAFSGCSGLTSVTIPNSVIRIEAYVFKDCVSLSSVVLPEGLSYIDSYTFLDCSSLKEVSIPKSVLRISGNAFKGCVNLDSVKISDISAWCGIIYNEDIYGSVITPLDYAHHLYLNDEEIKDLVIPKNVETIEKYSFRSCKGLTSVTFSDNIKTIGISAFYDCTGLTSVHISDLETWCKISLSGYAANPLYYAHHLFMNGEEIKDLVIPSSVTSISGAAFQGCSGLTSVTIGNGLTSIGNSAFSGCSSLTSITIGNGIKNIYKEAFASCPELTDFYCYAKDVPKASDDIFLNSYVDYATLHVHEKLIETYKSTSPWNTFKEIVKIDIPKYTITYSIDGEVYKSYEIEEGESITPEPAPTREGYTFSGWSEIPATMPAHNVTVTGSFTINQYTITYIIDNEVYTTQTVDYGSTIIPPTTPEREGYDFAWGDYPETMPAYDITIYGTYTTGIEAIMVNEVNCQIFSLDGKTLNKPQKGVNIVRMSNGQVRKVVVK